MYAVRSTYQPNFLIRKHHGKKAQGCKEDSKEGEEDDKAQGNEAQGVEEALVFSVKTKTSAEGRMFLFWLKMR